MNDTPQAPDDRSLPQAAPRATGQKPYAPPQLIAWGRLTELTQGGRGARQDFGPLVTKAI